MIRDLDAFDYLGATLCAALGLFALWLALDSVLDVVRGAATLSSEILSFMAMPIGLGFGYAGWRILHRDQDVARDLSFEAWLLVLVGLLLLGQAAIIWRRPNASSRQALITALQGLLFLSLAWSIKQRSRELPTV
jgi:hypothetical protein